MLICWFSDDYDDGDVRILYDDGFINVRVGSGCLLVGILSIGSITYLIVK